jgi:NAD(P)-dependent dehydrogenase (short-subunit alcohol dehydrogenase family)
MAAVDCRKVAFVTGASSGLGRTAAAAFVARGYATALVDLAEEPGRELEAQLNSAGEARFIRCDVAEDDAVRSAVEQTLAAFGRLDAAFNAAGFDGEQGLATADCTRGNWDRMMAVNLTGVWNCMRFQIPAMLRSGGGSIVNCGSVAGLRGVPFLPAYVAAKHGIVGLTKAAALEYAKQKIRVNIICPGLIDTPMLRAMSPEGVDYVIADTPMGRLGKPEEIAAMVVGLCEDDMGFVTGQAICVDGGWTVR